MGGSHLIAFALGVLVGWWLSSSGLLRGLMGRGG